MIAWGEYVKYFRDPVLATRLWQFLFFIFGFSMFTSGFPLFAEGEADLARSDAIRAGADRIRLRLGRVSRDSHAGAGAGQAGKEIWREGFEPRWVRGVCGRVYAAGVVVFDSDIVAGRGRQLLRSADSVRPTLTSLITKAAPRSEQWEACWGCSNRLDIGGADRGSSVWRGF